MNLTPAQSELVSAALAAGAEEAGAQLARATRRAWEIRTEVMSDGPADRFRLFLGGTIQPHYGAYLGDQCGAPVGTLVLIPAQSARSLIDDFARSYGPKQAKIERFDEAAVAEISNIVANALIAKLADALGTLLQLGSPEVATGTRLDHLERALDRFTGHDCFLMLAHFELREGDTSVESFAAFIMEREFLSGLLEKAALP